MGRKSKEEGVHVHVEPIRFLVQQKLTRHCKATIWPFSKMPDSFHGPSESFLEGQAAPGESTSWQEVILLFWVYPPKANTLSERPAAGETPLALLSLHQPSHSTPSTGFLPALTSFPISPHSHSSNPPGRLALTYSNILSVLLAFSILHLSDASLRSSHCFAS